MSETGIITLVGMVAAGMWVVFKNYPRAFTRISISAIRPLGFAAVAYFACASGAWIGINEPVLAPLVIKTSLGCGTLLVGLVLFSVLLHTIEFLDRQSGGSRNPARSEKTSTDETGTLPED